MTLLGSYIFWPSSWGTSHADQSRMDFQRVFPNVSTQGSPKVAPEPPGATASSFCHSNGVENLKTREGCRQGLGGLSCHCCQLTRLESPWELLTRPSLLLLPGVPPESAWPDRSEPKARPSPLSRICERRPVVSAVPKAAVLTGGDHISISHPQILFNFHNHFK